MSLTAKEKDEYIPFGPEWKKEVMKLSINIIEKTFGFKHQEKELKSDFIDRIKGHLNKPN